jgi:NitT/TauT family transport system permease protein
VKEAGLPRSFLRILSPIALLLVWELAGRSGLVNTQILPPPSRALADLIASGELLKAISASLYCIVCGFAMAVVAGITLGATMVRSQLFDLLLDPLVELLRPISPLAIFPLALPWLGIGDASEVFIIALAASGDPLHLCRSARHRAQSFRPAQSMGASPREIFTSIVLPGSLPQTFTGGRFAWGISLIVIIAAEMVGASVGIGYMVLEAQQTFRTERVVAGIIVIGLFGFLTDLGFRRLRRLILPRYG